MARRLKIRPQKGKKTPHDHNQCLSGKWFACATKTVLCTLWSHAHFAHSFEILSQVFPQYFSPIVTGY